MSSQFQAYAAVLVAIAAMIATALFTKVRLQRRQQQLRKAANERHTERHEEQIKQQPESRPTLIVNDSMMAQLKGSGVYVMQLADATTTAVKDATLKDQLTDEERAAL